MTKYYHTLKVNKHGVLATVFVVDSTRILAYFDSELVKHTSLKYVIFRTENFFSLAKEHFVINSQTQPHALIVHSFNGLVRSIRTKKLPKNPESMAAWQQDRKSASSALPPKALLGAQPL